MREFDQTQQALRVMIATPLGLGGRGGIDRLNDLIFQVVSSRSELGIHVDRLVTRGQGGLCTAQFVFAYALMQLSSAALRGKVDLLHIHLSDRGSSYRKVVLGAAARLLDIPYVIHLHGAVFDEFWSNAPRGVAFAINSLFVNSEHIIVLGHHWARVIGDRLPHVVRKIRVMPNATQTISSNRIPATDGRIRISCLGELGRRKGTPELIKALSLLGGRSDWTATVAGNGEVEESRAQIRSLGIHEKVNVPGWLDPTAIKSLLSRTDLLVLPSFAENLPMVILEAFAHGVPVVSTSVGAIPETVDHGRNGLLIAAGDVTALASAIKQLIEDHELRRNLGQAALRDHTERFEIGSYVTQLVAIWRQSGMPRRAAIRSLDPSPKSDRFI